MSNNIKKINEKTNYYWYVVHAYPGLEEKAKENLIQKIKQFNLKNMFREILIPIESISTFKSGKKEKKIKKCFPGYILIEMNLNNETENLVKNTSKITGFINSNKKPQKLKKNEILKFKKFGKNIIRHTETTYSIGDQIKIIEGPFNEFNGSVSEVKPEKKKVRVLVSIFGRFTPVELDFNQLEPLS